MDAYRAQIDECTDLESLFKIWKEAHKNEKNYEYTFPKNNDGIIPPEEFKTSWNDDGFLSENKENIEILFVLKEPNDQKSIDDDYFGEKGFWLKDNINNFRCAIPRRMFKAAEEKLGKGITRKNWVTKAAVMNLNKRGGYSKTYDPEQISNYVNIYRDFIRKEIEIINPKIIIFLCGNNDNTKSIIENLSIADKYRVYYSYHPSYKGKKNAFNDSRFLETITLF